jgi:protoporphyrinogen oxidase
VADRIQNGEKFYFQIVIRRAAVMSKNESQKTYECCIIGAGPAGLGVALELVKNGVTNILIIDKNKTVGGLSRTEEYDGVRFDIGPHRFFSKNKEANEIWRETLGEHFLPVARLTRIFYKNKYFRYPIKPFDVLVKLGPMESFRAFLSLIYSQINRKNKVDNFENWTIRKFGRRLYLAFFKTYTEKVWGIPCEQIGAEWAAQRIKGLSFFQVVKNSLLGNRKKKIKTLVEEFDYPIHGAGQMYQAMRDKILAKGGEFMLQTLVVNYNREGNEIKSITVVGADGKKKEIKAKHFFNSAPLAHFFQKLQPRDSDEINNSVARLKYRDHISVDLLINKEHLFFDQWIYIHSPEISAARIVKYNNFSKKMAPEKKIALGVEYFVFKDEKFWNESDNFVAKFAIAELEKMGLLKETDVEKFWVVRESEAYPVSYLGFQEHYELLKSRMDSFSNISAIGRAGMHKYNNQDHSLISGILAARNYLKLEGSPFNLWNINIDAEYQEGIERVNK